MVGLSLLQVSSVVLLFFASLYSPDLRFLFLVNVLVIGAVVAFTAAVVMVLQRRSYQRRFEEEKLVAVGTAMSRILHQIKNPLQTVMLQAELLQEPSISEDPEARREVCQAITSESERLAAMLNELALWASGSRRALSLEPTPLHLLVQQVVGNEKLEAERYGVALQVRELEELTVFADPYFLRQALENLVRNAREAVMGKADGRMEVALERQGALAVVRIADNGPGISSDDQDQIFSPFVTTKGKGMGLGLPICREIVRGHRGEVRVESRPGTGTTFRVFLPLHGG